MRRIEEGGALAVPAIRTRSIPEERPRVHLKGRARRLVVGRAHELDPAEHRPINPARGNRHRRYRQETPPPSSANSPKSSGHRWARTRHGSTPARRSRGTRHPRTDQRWALRQSGSECPSPQENGDRPGVMGQMGSLPLGSLPSHVQAASVELSQSDFGLKSGQPLRLDLRLYHLPCSGFVPRTERRWHTR